MKLIVGLGNPGRKYHATRHNVGYDVVDELARRFADGNYKQEFQGESARIAIDSQRVLLLRPTTYMNLSGSSVGRATDFYKMSADDVLVVCDDFHLPTGKLRLRAKGSSGGQKGLGDIIRRLGTEEISRLRIGVGPVTEGMDPANFVLRKFPKQQSALIEETIQRAADAATCWAESGIEEAMNRYNGSES